MLISIALAALVAITAIATALALLDSWIRGRFVFEGLKRESALLDAGFVPMAGSGEHRLREPVRFDALAAFGRAPSRMPSQRLKADRKRSTPRQFGHGAA